MTAYRLTQIFYQKVTHHRITDFDHEPSVDEIRDAFLEDKGQACGIGRRLLNKAPPQYGIAGKA